MAKLISVVPNCNYKLFLRFDDGLAGEYSCTELIKNKEFEKLADTDVFNNVAIDPVTNDVYWDKETAICSAALYKQLELKRLMKVFKIDPEKE